MLIRVFWEPAALHIHVYVSDAEITSYDEEKEGVFNCCSLFSYHPEGEEWIHCAAYLMRVNTPCENTDKGIKSEC